MEPRLGRYIWTHTKPQQMWILVVVALSMIPYFMSFNLPKQIVNGPIQGQGFEDAAATQLFMRLEFDLPVLGNVLLFPGIPLDRVTTLFALSAVFLALVIVNGLFKFYINTYKGRLGERLLRRIRFDLVDRILRFPPAAFKRIKGAEVSSMVKDEVEPLGGFTGDAFVLPAMLGGQALTALVFIFLQSVPLGLITAALVGVQAFIIPRMRRRLLILGRERQLTARELAGRVSEIVDGIHTIRAYDTSNFERADIASRLGLIFRIRYDIYQWKFLVKFINNFLASVTPFLFYSVGGWLALQGRLDIGQLVAVIGAYKDLPGPLKELIDWDQTRQDLQVKYSQVVTQFAVDEMIEADIQAVSVDAGGAALQLPLVVANLSVADDSGAMTLERVNLKFEKGEKVAIVGDVSSGGDALADAVARVVWPDSGRILAGDADIHRLPEAVLGRSISYAPEQPYFFYGSLRDNLLYGLKHAPLLPPNYDDKQAQQRRWHQREALMSGNPDHDINGDWIDYRSAGAAGPADLPQLVFAALTAVSMTKDVFDLAIRSTIDVTRYADLTGRIVEIRRALREDLAGQDMSGLIVPFEPGAYNTEATVIENLLFGNVDKTLFPGSSIGNDPYFRRQLDAAGLSETLFAMGTSIAENAIELFSDLPRDHPFFQQMSFMSADDIPTYAALLQRIRGQAFASLAEADRTVMIRLSFDYVEPRHRFGLLTPEIREQVVAFRRAFHEEMPDHLRGAVELYDPDRYMATAALLDNMLFGRVSHQYRDRADRIYASVAGLLKPLGLFDSVLSIGLDFHVGAGGRRLTVAQRQKLSLARAILRQSDCYVFNRPLSALDFRQQDQITRAVLDRLEKSGRDPLILWVLTGAALAPLFERIVLFSKGQVVEDGTYRTLIEKNGMLAEVIAGEPRQSTARAVQEERQERAAE